MRVISHKHFWSKNKSDKIFIIIMLFLITHNFDVWISESASSSQTLLLYFVVYSTHTHFDVFFYRLPIQKLYVAWNYLSLSPSLTFWFLLKRDSTCFSLKLMPLCNIRWKVERRRNGEKKSQNCLLKKSWTISRLFIIGTHRTLTAWFEGVLFFLFIFQFRLIVCLFVR